MLDKRLFRRLTVSLLPDLAARAPSTGSTTNLDMPTIFAAGFSLETDRVVAGRQRAARPHLGAVLTPPTTPRGRAPDNNADEFPGLDIAGSGW